MERTEPISVAIVDDQDLVRAGFAMVIGSQDDMTVVGQGADGEQAVDLASRLRPDVILMDVRMPGMDGLTATHRITALSPDRPEPRVIVLTTFDLDEYVMAAIKAGASGFLLKDTEPETLLTSIRTVHQGNAIIAPSATKRLIEHMAHDMPPTGSMPSGSIYRDPEADLLTDRELQVLVHIAQGLSNQEIADNLGISLPTVKTHVTHILQKINARDRVQAVVFAYENHLV
ncbi:response regulator [Bifidobacterium asteroides]|uniref:response regulator n=1 Tax=Bifidobacterium asteroides TaxID=1684 RepID=UPI003A809364